MLSRKARVSPVAREIRSPVRCVEYGEAQSDQPLHEQPSYPQDDALPGALEKVASDRIDQCLSREDGGEGQHKAVEGIGCADAVDDLAYEHGLGEAERGGGGHEGDRGGDEAPMGPEKAEHFPDTHGLARSPTRRHQLRLPRA